MLYYLTGTKHFLKLLFRVKIGENDIMIIKKFTSKILILFFISHYSYAAKTLAFDHLMRENQLIFSTAAHKTNLTSLPNDLKRREWNGVGFLAIIKNDGPSTPLCTGSLVKIKNNYFILSASSCVHFKILDNSKKEYHKFERAHGLKFITFYKAPSSDKPLLATIDLTLTLAQTTSPWRQPHKNLAFYSLKNINNAHVKHYLENTTPLTLDPLFLNTNQKSSINNFAKELFENTENQNSLTTANYTLVGYGHHSLLQDPSNKSELNKYPKFYVHENCQITRGVSLSDTDSNLKEDQGPDVHFSHECNFLEYSEGAPILNSQNQITAIVTGANTPKMLAHQFILGFNKNQMYPTLNSYQSFEIKRTALSDPFNQQSGWSVVPHKFWNLFDKYLSNELNELAL